MTRDEIIRMARGAGLYHFHDSEGHCSGITDAVLVDADKERDDERLVQMLMPFAALVAAAEREAIAKSLDKQADLACDEFDRQWAQEMAAAVRARGNT